MTDKTVNVRMSGEFHSILKAYCVLVNKTMSEVLYDWARHELHTQSLFCNSMTQLLANNNSKVDPRVNKPCWGFRCNLFVHEKACRVGKEEKLFIIDPKWRHSIKSDAKYINEFDGSSVDCCLPSQAFDKLNYKAKS